MGTLDASIEQYKQNKKNADAELARLEQQAGELAERLDDLHDSEVLLADCERGIENTASEKQMVREAVQEADLLGDHGRAEELKEEYRELVEQERQLHEQVEHLTRVIEKNRVDSRDVAAIRARLRRVNAGGSVLIGAVREAVAADTTALRGRAATVEEELPPADAIEMFRALGFEERADGFERTIEQNDGIAPGSGERVRERAGRELQRLLSKI